MNVIFAAMTCLLLLSACATYDRAAGTNTSGYYPSQRDGTRNNPSGTALGRAYDRASGNNVSGAYPRHRARHE